ncbi:diacylglycerol kinase [Salipiger pallidus]|uniref:Diacylglycerol kinase n=1 Tax=Salipiger pallidus TaxID=1775170 RepID=A0A8J2ZLV6_9RHOB|nr:diacylglycerol kinase family protein [Salipiger pallidus]GGG79852.1 diacylglycerol kinase [Salipiger pallidus]
MPDLPRMCVILNERSGDHAEGESRRDRMQRLMAEAGIDAEVVSPGKVDDLVATSRDALRRTGAGMLVAAGGDGTIAAVAAAAHDEGVPMSVIPQGTFNYFARGLGIPEEMEGAIEAMAGGRFIEMPLGEVNGEVFLNNSSLGIYPLILQRREGIYRRWGRSRVAAYWSVLLALFGFRRPLRLRMTIDGTQHTLRTAMVFVGSSAYQLDLFKLDGADAVRNGGFAIFTSKGQSSMDLVRTALKLAGGAARKGEDYEFWTGRDIRIEMKRKRALVARDGEKSLMQPPIHIRMRDLPLRVLVPQSAEISETPSNKDAAAAE